MPTSTMVARHCRADSRQFLDSSTANFPTDLGKLAVSRCNCIEKLSDSGQFPVWTPDRNDSHCKIESATPASNSTEMAPAEGVFVLCIDIMRSHVLIGLFCVV